MNKNLKINRIFRILAGIYLLFTSVALWRELDNSANPVIGIGFIVLFVVAGTLFIIFSARDLIRMKKEMEEETDDSHHISVKSDDVDEDVL